MDYIFNLKNMKDLYNSILKGDLDTVKSCCESLVNIEINDYLNIACSLGHIKIVKYFVSLGADIHNYYNRAIKLACQYGHLEVVKYLYESGANFRAGNNYAIVMASKNDHYEVVKYLSEIGADISRISEKHKKYISFCHKMEAKKRERAQKKIYYWWIPICYDITRECGQRMKYKNLTKAQELGYKFSN